MISDLTLDIPGDKLDFFVDKQNFDKMSNMIYFGANVRFRGILNSKS